MSEKQTVILTKQNEKYRYISCLVIYHQSGIILPLNEEKRTKEDMNMTIEGFAEKVKDMVAEEVSEYAVVLTGTILKNNGVVWHNITIKRKNMSVGMSIYLEKFFMEYCNRQKELKDIVREIITIENSSDMEIDITKWFVDYEKVKEKIRYKLVNYEKNRELLKKIPHEKFLDLVKVYYVNVEFDSVQKGKIMIYNDHIKAWGITESEIKEIAEKNMENLIPGMILPMEEMILNIVRKSNMDFKTELEAEESIEELFGKQELHMYVATNKENVYGAATMCYGNLIKNFAHEIKSDFYILPCSVHEIILVPARDVEMWQAEELKDMVREINTIEIPEEEILSNSVYYFNRVSDEITII